MRPRWVETNTKLRDMVRVLDKVRYLTVQYTKLVNYWDLDASQWPLEQFLEDTKAIESGVPKFIHRKSSLKPWGRDNFDLRPIACQDLGDPDEIYLSANGGILPLGVAADILCIDVGTLLKIKLSLVYDEAVIASAVRRMLMPRPLWSNIRVTPEPSSEQLEQIAMSLLKQIADPTKAAAVSALLASTGASVTRFDYNEFATEYNGIPLNAPVSIEQEKGRLAVFVDQLSRRGLVRGTDYKAADVTDGGKNHIVLSRLTDKAAAILPPPPRRRRISAAVEIAPAVTTEAPAAPAVSEPAPAPAAKGGKK